MGEFYLLSNVIGTVTNVALVDAVQQQWIDFIARDVLSSDQVFKNAATKPTAIIYGTDRSSEVVSIDEHAFFQEQKKRFAILSENWAQVQVIASAITANKISITTEART